MVSDPAAPGSLPPAALVSPELVMPAGMVHEQFHAMGTTVTLLLPEEQAGTGSRLVRALFTEWEQTLSRFLPESELSQINAHPGEPVTVSQLLYTVLTMALTAAQATHGIYDPTLLDQLAQLGYDRSFDELPSALPEAAYHGRPGGGWHQIQVNPGLHFVMLPAGVKLDFGGIAKGMAVDAALQKLQQAGIDVALVNAGGDLAVLGLPPQADHWSVAAPLKDTSWTIPLHHGAIATSGIARRHWSQGHDLRHHLLDPRTGMPASSNLWSVTVVAARCEQAEVAAKVAFILGPEKGKAFLQEHQLAGLFVDMDDRWETVGPWPIHLVRKQL